MGKIDIAISALRSRRMRSRILGENNLTKTIGGKPKESFVIETIKKVATGLFGGVIKLGGFLLGAISYGFQFTFTSLFSILVNSIQFIWNFNFNETDTNLDKMVERLNVRIASQLGSTLGNLTGYLACGIIPAAGIFTLNEAMGMYLLKEVGEEALEEFVANIRSLIQVSAQALVQRSIINSFKSVRRALKGYFKDSSSKQSKMVRRVFGNGFNNAVKGWGTEGSQPWSFAGKLEEKLDSIKNPVTRAFAEEFLEEFGEGCIEAGYVLAGGLDSWVMQQRISRETQFGKERAIEIIPDREAHNPKAKSSEGKGEVIVIKGKEELIKPAIIQTMATHQLIYNRDIGMIIAQEAVETVAKLTQERQLHILFRSKEKPPWKMPNGETALITEITVRNCKKGLKWREIKLAAKPYNWGKFKAEAFMSDGQKMVAWGATSEEAVAKFKELAELSTLTYKAINVIEEVERNNAVKKEPTRVYPSSCTLLVKRISNDTTGRLDIEGRRWKETPIVIDLWVDDEPPQFQGALDTLYGD